MWVVVPVVQKRSSSGSGRRFGSTDRAARFGAVFGHPNGVGFAFTSLGPVNAFFITSFGIRDGVRVSASVSDSRATSTVGFANITARLLAVRDHPVRVSGTLWLVFLVGPGMARCVSVFFAELGISRAGNWFRFRFLSADRAARFGTVREHPVRVGGTLRRFGSSPGRARKIFISAFGSVSRTESGILSV